MAWIREEHAGALAVVFTWLIAISPWAVTMFRPSGITVIAFRFLPFRLLYIFGAEFPGEQPFIWAWEVAGFQVEPEVVLAGHVGTVALAVGVVTVALSVVYYAREDALTEVLPFHPVRLFGALHAVLAVLLLVATGLFFAYHAGPTIPIGAALAGIFAYLLLTVDLAVVDEADEEEAEVDEADVDEGSTQKAQAGETEGGRS